LAWRMPPPAARVRSLQALVWWSLAAVGAHASNASAPPSVPPSSLLCQANLTTGEALRGVTAVLDPDGDGVVDLRRWSALESWARASAAFGDCSPPASPLSPGQQLRHDVEARLVIEADLASFQLGAFGVRLAQRYSVDASAVSTSVAEGSIIARSVITLQDAAAMRAAVADLLTAELTTLSADLGVVVNEVAAVTPIVSITGALPPPKHTWTTARYVAVAVPCSVSALGILLGLVLILRKKLCEAGEVEVLETPTLESVAPSPDAHGVRKRVEA